MVSRRVIIRFDHEQIGTQTFSAIFGPIKCTEQYTKNSGKSNHAKSFFLRGIQDGRYNKKFTLSPRALTSVFTIVQFGFKASFSWSDYSFS